MPYHTLTPEEALKQVDSHPKRGLTTMEARERLTKFGPNRLQEAPGKSLFRRLFEQLSDFMTLVLLGAAAISFLTSLWQGVPDYVEPAIILAIILLNSILGLVQESRAEKSLAALKRLSSPHALVLRDGTLQEIASEELVPGDIIHLKAGQFIPADARLLTSQDLKVDEASLTGESLPVSKEANRVFPENTPAADRRNLVSATGIVTSGHGTAVVIATGMETGVGQVAALINQEEDSSTPLQLRMQKTGKYLGFAALGICILIFIAGTMQHRPVFDMFMTSVSLAVAAIPEGLPAVITVMLSLGVQRMARKKAIVRRLTAVEALGSATVICSDKTGTLTQNKMTVEELFPGNDKKHLLSLAALCCNVTGEFGDPTEIAIQNAAKDAGISLEELTRSYPRIHEIPFDSVRKSMTTVHRLPNGKYRIITKGAPDLLYPKCRFPKAADRKQTEIKQQQLSENALRVLAVAWRDVDPKEYHASFPDQDLTFCGLIGMMDPPRPEVPDAIARCQMAGIIPVMITGDHAATAKSIAARIGIHLTGNVLTGSQLDTLTEDQLVEQIRHCRVFARVTPAHKVRIVKAFQSQGHLVAMTGDGINDAPALRAADIGCAMGEGGTDVARNAADIILADDNFATIVAAVEEGRGIYDNIRKAIHFLLSCNVGEILTILVAILLGLPAPLMAVQLLWINLVTDSLPAIALGMEAPEPGIMRRSPKPPSDSFFTPALTVSILVEGALIGFLSLTAFLLGQRYGQGANALPLARTMCFCVLSFSQLFHAFNVRSTRSLFHHRSPGNKAMLLAFLCCATLQIVVIMIPALADIFRVVTLDIKQWILVILLSLIPVPLMELQKSLRHQRP